jgi:hypothetical protein
MRLLRLEPGGGYSLHQSFGSKIPPYAILSHTWGQDQDEVSYRDIQEGTGKEKIGQRKLAFCAKQAAHDSLRYFWVDTCCIDKSSSAELSEAINSMFCWYRNSARCYAYLPDVTASNVNDDQTFRQSRWFTRGWTLQELLAPKDVQFFSGDGVHLGNRSSPIIQIHITRICGIPRRALQEAPLSSFSVEERMSWTRGRETKREEDMAYSLLGIFGCHMSLIYGEGKENALQRLRNKIDKATKNNVGVPDVHATAQTVLAVLSEGTDEYDAAAEIEWKAVTERWKQKDCCCNCGSAHHWEYECRKNCGRCKVSTIYI